jgi:hypothetical protein
MHHELFGDRWRGQALGGVVMALVPHDADELCRQRVVQQLDDVFAPRAVARRHGTLVERLLGGFELAVVEHELFTLRGVLGLVQLARIAGVLLHLHVLLLERIRDWPTAPIPSGASKRLCVDG